jgi:DNA (cytosine-5)-methyltransferase 1
VREATKKGYAEAYEGDSINLEQPNSTTRRGRVGKQVAQTLNTTAFLQGVVVNEPVNPMPDGTCRTIKNQYYKTSKANFDRSSTFGATGVTDGLRIRKLTPKECFRLMGFDDESFHKAEAVNSNTQLYKQAGNSIVVDVLEELFCMILDEDGNLYV